MFALYGNLFKLSRNYILPIDKPILLGVLIHSFKSQNENDEIDDAARPINGWRIL